MLPLGQTNINILKFRKEQSSFYKVEGRINSLRGWLLFGGGGSSLLGNKNHLTMLMQVLSVYKAQHKLVKHKGSVHGFVSSTIVYLGTVNWAINAIKK